MSVKINDLTDERQFDATWIDAQPSARNIAVGLMENIKVRLTANDLPLNCHPAAIVLLTCSMSSVLTKID